MRPTTTASPDRWKELLDQLEHKYQASGQDLNSYLEGLLYTEYLNYWDYIQLDTLLTLQVPRTAFPDEEIFIMYHQVTELYFKLILQEIKQLTAGEQTTTEWEKRLARINRYMEALIKSFDVMVDGMDPEQFLKFRMALLPASGFQSVQFRTIEILSTRLTQLSNDPEKDWTDATVDELVNQIYWQAGATELATGKQTLTLKRFSEKYGREMRLTAADYQTCNLAVLVDQLEANNQLTDGLRSQLRAFDASFNINWRLMHFKSAVRYLQKEPDIIAATGGTNWQKYLPPRFQNRTFFPHLWSAEERGLWGKSWFEELMASLA